MITAAEMQTMLDALKRAKYAGVRQSSLRIALLNTTAWAE